MMKKKPYKNILRARPIYGAKGNIKDTVAHKKAH